MRLGWVEVSYRGLERESFLIKFRPDPFFSIAVHNSALGSMLLSFSRGIMAWAAVVVVDEGRGISFKSVQCQQSDYAVSPVHEKAPSTV